MSYQLDLMLSVGDTPASPSVLPGSSEAQKMTAISGQKCSELSKTAGPVGLFVKMFLDMSAWDSTRCYLTWKAKATPHNRLLFQLAPLDCGIDATGFGLLPTVRASIYKKPKMVDSGEIISKFGRIADAYRLRAFIGKTDQPGMVGVAHGVSNWVDRSKALGNAVVPQIPEIIGRCILEIEKQCR